MARLIHAKIKEPLVDADPVRHAGQMAATWSSMKCAAS